MVDTNSGPGKQVRLHVTNASRGGVQRVRAFMHVLEGSAREHFLHVQHDNDPVGLRQASRFGESLTVGQPVHFDVMLVMGLGQRRRNYAIRIRRPRHLSHVAEARASFKMAGPNGGERLDRLSRRFAGFRISC